MRFAVAILTSLFGGFWTVLFKKAVTLNHAWPLANIFLGYHFVFFVGLISLLFGSIRTPFESFSSWYILFFLGYMLLYYTLSPLEQKAMSIERLSCLQPYSNLGKLIAIVCGFLILGERNIVTFIVAIIAFICTMVYASRGSKGRMSKGVFYYIISQSIRWVMAVCIALMLTQNDLIWLHLSGLELASYESMFSVLILASVLFASGQVKGLKNNSRQFYVYRYGWCVLGDMGWILGLLLVAELGIITSSILSLITIATTLTLGYFFFHDKPEKRDISFALLIIVLICIGYVFRGVEI